ncbi:hypothetical protein ACWERE_48190, partial [Rhodococcus koreensis]
MVVGRRRRLRGGQQRVLPDDQERDRDRNLVNNLPDTVNTLIGGGDQILITSPPGYLQGRLFGLTLPVLL